jgi:hypothetical protein
MFGYQESGKGRPHHLFIGHTLNKNHWTLGASFCVVTGQGGVTLDSLSDDPNGRIPTANLN